MRRLALILLAALFAHPAMGAATEAIVSANYTLPTTRYDHAILGDAIEYGALDLRLDDGRNLRLTLPENRVFEDIAPRLADLDGDGAPEVIVVETDLGRGARLAVYGAAGLIAATPFIGRTHRWLAPIGAADLDGDGRVEIAYIDRPHLARTLKVWRFHDGRLTLVAKLGGLTNHQIGQDHITGGIRTCGQTPEIITLNAGWTQVMATRLQAGRLQSRALGPFTGSVTGPMAVRDALRCWI